MKTPKGDKVSKFSKFYNEKTVDILRGTEVQFQVTVTEISTKSKEDIQREQFKAVDRNVSGYSKQGAKREMERRISEVVKKVDGVEQTVITTILPGIKSWTLTDDDGNPAPISYTTWEELPDFITKQIEKAVEELNPETDEDFPDSGGIAD